MSVRPKISVITVSRNSVGTIERTIRSVLDQTYPEIEYIVIDGGSTDGTVAVIERYADSLAHWATEPDRGISHAFNKGISAAHGELIGIINADDWYEPDAVARMASSYANGRPDVLFGNLGRPGRVQRPDRRFQDKIAYVMPTLNHPTWFVKAEAYRRFGTFNERYRIAMDFDLLRRFHALGATFRYVDHIISNMSRGGISDTNLLLRYTEILEIAGYHPKTFFFLGLYQLTRWTARARSSRERRAAAGGREIVSAWTCGHTPGT
jgi:glycosyltransferase involved in cell wall biosynthesis